MSKCTVQATIVVPVVVEVDIEDGNIERHGGTMKAIEMAVEEAVNIHVIFSDIFDRGRVEAADHVQVDNWNFE